MFSILKTTIRGDSFITQYLADYESDIANLPTSTSRGTQGESTLKENAKCLPASECLVMENSVIWELNNSDEWIKTKRRSAAIFHKFL